MKKKIKERKERVCEKENKLRKEVSRNKMEYSISINNDGLKSKVYINTHVIILLPVVNN